MTRKITERELCQGLVQSVLYEKHSADMQTDFGGHMTALTEAFNQYFADLMSRDGHSKMFPGGGHDVVGNKKLQDAIFEIGAAYIPLCRVVGNLYASAVVASRDGKSGDGKSLGQIRDEFVAINMLMVTQNFLALNRLKGIDYRLSDEAVKDIVIDFCPELIGSDIDIKKARNYVSDLIAMEIMGSIIRRSIEACQQIFKQRPTVVHDVSHSGTTFENLFDNTVKIMAADCSLHR